MARSSLLRCCSTWSSLSCRPARSLSLSRTTSKGWPVGCQSASRTRWDDQLSATVNPFQIFLSERESSDRNHALAFFMRENKCFPKWAFFPLLGVSLKIQGAQHHQGLCRHQDNPRLLLSTLLPRDDHGEHVSQNLKWYNIQNIAQVSDGGHSGEWGDLSGHLREGSRQ